MFYIVNISYLLKFKDLCLYALNMKHKQFMLLSCVILFINPLTETKYFGRINNVNQICTKVPFVYFHILFILYIKCLDCKSFHR